MASVNGEQIFSAGRFFGINNVSNPTPARAYVPQDMSVDFKQATKELFGENKFAVAIGAGEMSVTGKVTMGADQPRLLNDLLVQGSAVAGQILEANKEAITVSTSSGTIQVANAAAFRLDLGVLKSDGTVFTRMSAVAATGQYSVATTGVYTLSTGDESANLLVSYLYNNTSAGETVTMTNQPQGPAGAFTAVMAFLWGSGQNILTLNNAIATDHGVATKIGDFAKPTFGFMASTDTTDTLGTWSYQLAA
jgi:hypothetical protein